MYAPYGPYFAFIPEFLPANVAAPAIGAINAFGALGGFAGAYVVGVLGGGTKSGGAFIFMAAALLGSAVLMLFVKRPAAIAEPPTPMRIPTYVRGISLPANARHSGRLKTH